MHSLARIAAGLVLLTGCRTSTSLPDLFEPSEFTKAFRDRMRTEMTAPIILVGRVVRSRLIGAARRSLHDSRVLLQLTQVTVEPEQILKGPDQGDQLTFYYYDYSSANDRDLGIPRYIPRIGQRRIYFLQPFRGGFRSVGDVADYTVTVWSGYHSRDFCKGKSVGCCIAEILLEPGTGYDSLSFANQLARAASAATVFCSRTVALRLVQQLADNSDRQISRAADDILKAAKANGEL